MNIPAGALAPALVLGSIPLPACGTTCKGCELLESLEIRTREGRLELEPVSVPMRLVRRGRGLVATTEEPLPAITADDVRAVLDSQRR